MDGDLLRVVVMMVVVLCGMITEGACYYQLCTTCLVGNMRIDQATSPLIAPLAPILWVYLDTR